MKIDKNLCVGCGSCVPYCTVGAISIEEGKALVDYDRCVLCNNCVRAAPCPIEECISVIPPESLDESSSLATHLSDVITIQPQRLITNDYPQVLRGTREVAFTIELGRPGQTSTLSEVRKVIDALTNVGIKLGFYSARWDSRLGKKVETLLTKQQFTENDKELLNAKWICGPILEFVVNEENLPHVIEVLENASMELNTVMSVNLMQKYDRDGRISVMKKLESIGIEYSPNGQVKLRHARGVG